MSRLTGGVRSGSQRRLPQLCWIVVLTATVVLTDRSVAQGPLFPDLRVERRVSHLDQAGVEQGSTTVVETYGGHWMVREGEGDRRTIVDFQRREITEVSGGRYWLIGFDRLASLREELFDLELGGGTTARLDRASQDLQSASGAAGTPGSAGRDGVSMLRVVVGSEAESAAPAALEELTASWLRRADAASEPPIVVLRVDPAAEAPEAVAAGPQEAELHAWVGAEQTFSVRARGALLDYAESRAGSSEYQLRRQLMGARLTSASEAELLRTVDGRLIERKLTPLGRGDRQGWTLDEITDIRRLERNVVAQLVEIGPHLVRRTHPIEQVTSTLRELSERASAWRVQP